MGIYLSIYLSRVCIHIYMNLCQRFLGSSRAGVCVCGSITARCVCVCVRVYIYIYIHYTRHESKGGGLTCNIRSERRDRFIVNEHNFKY
jgi:hypothetical protein